MAEDARSENRLLSKHKWRGKLFSTEWRSAESLESTDNDVANFLQGANAKPEAKSRPIAIAPRPSIAADARRFSVQSSPLENIDVYRRPKPRQNKGMRVNFTTASPEIIGEGGDEAELPAREVSISYQRSVGPDRSKAREPALAFDKESSPEGEERPSESEGEALFRPTSLQRTPIVLDDIPLETHRDDGYHDANAADSVYSTSPGENYKPLPQPPIKRYEQHGYHNVKEIRRKELPRDMPSTSDQVVDSDGRHGTNMGTSKGHGLVPSLDIASPDTIASNSGTPRPSPQPPANYQKVSSSSYGFPYAEPISQSPPKQADLPPQTRHQYTKEPSATTESKPLSLRNVTRGLGEDSLDDFDARVRRFNDIFRLGISAQTDMMKVPFVQWIRTATWWFLKGRGALESTVRGRSSGAGRASPEPLSDPAVALKQAYVNLAKAWWIVREITPNHPEELWRSRIG
ncbi:hypothetical protein ABVK25_002808 [Lepraria finkii]|uniref:Uncharacterized protein n=1 Tax=Lepraria finkii TaxID=1340010 RepID=A0ABR4BGX2_9LECA